MVSKKILGVAIAAAFSSSAFAADFALNATGSTAALKVAKSTISDAGKVTVASPAAANQGAPGDYYVVTADDTNLDFDVAGPVGIGLAAAQKLYVRVELTNAVFKTPVVVGDLVVTNYDASATATAPAVTDTVSQGGAAGDKVVVFTVSPSDAADYFRTSDTFAMNFTNIAATGSSDVGIKVTFHDTIVNGVNGTSALSTAMDAGVLSFVDGVKTTITSSTQTADADTLFKKLLGVNYGTKAELAKIEVVPEANVMAADGTTLTLAKLFSVAADKSIYTLTGDFSNADYSIVTDSSAVANGASCASAAGGTITVNGITEFVNNDATATNNNNKTTNKANAEYKVSAATLGIVAGDTQSTSFLCVKKQDNGLVLSPAEFKTAITFDKSALWAAPAVAATASGTLVRNGVTIQVPYLTTFADYNQRLVLVNRGTTDAAYSISFTPDVTTGATATAGAAATGTLKAGKVTTLKATDLVTLAGATRTAATVTVVAADSKIDAATTTVNTADKSTDTVKLK